MHTSAVYNIHTFYLNNLLTLHLERLNTRENHKKKKKIIDFAQLIANIVYINANVDELNLYYYKNYYKNKSK